MLELHLKCPKILWFCETGSEPLLMTSVSVHQTPNFTILYSKLIDVYEESFQILYKNQCRLHKFLPLPLCKLKISNMKVYWLNLSVNLLSKRVFFSIFYHLWPHLFTYNKCFLNGSAISWLEFVVFLKSKWHRGLFPSWRCSSDLLRERIEYIE